MNIREEHGSAGRFFVLALVVAAAFYARGAGIDPARDWPGWRGPTHDGVAVANQNPPLKWSETEGMLWKAAIPGRGHGSPTIVGNRVYLATADDAKKSQSVLCLDRDTGKMVWQTDVHKSGADPGHHSNSSAASPSVACDGERLYINFLNSGAVYTSALDLNGKVLWQQKVADFVVHQGYGASPVLYENVVIVAADNRAGGAVAGLDKRNGKIIWSQPRPKLPNYTTPAIVQAGGRTQAVLGGCNLVSSFDPATGKKLWEIEGSTEECVVTPVTDGERIFTSGGYPKNHTVAIMADGSGKVAWQNNARVYVPSMIAHGGHLYAVMDAGMAVCWKSASGQELWKERLGGDFFATPVMVGDRMYATNLRGKTYVFQATPQSFKVLAENQLGDECYASPAICGSRIYLRHAKRGEQRQEFLYCVGNQTF